MQDSFAKKVKLFYSISMRKSIYLIVVVMFLITSVGVKRAHAINPRVKILATMATYGTAGGALLGAASMAFKSNGRAVFQGASIGLWAGLLFGSYIVITHAVKTSQSSSPVPQDEGDYYPDEEGPYEDGEEDDIGPYEGESPEARNRNPVLFDSEFIVSDNLAHKLSPKIKQGSSVYMNLLNVTF